MRKNLWSNARFSLFLTAITPMVIWPLSPLTHLARPMEVLVWGLICACISAFAPGRWLRFLAWLQVLTLPWTLGWIGVVAVTGYGPTNDAFDAAAAFAPNEIWSAIKLAFVQPAFIVVATLTFASCGWVIWTTNLPSKNKNRTFDAIFVCALLGLCVANLDTTSLSAIARIAGPESRLSVPLLSHIDELKDVFMGAVNRTAWGSTFDDLHLKNHERSVSSAPKLFSARDGLAVFIVGESLRADALINKNRGHWSVALADRFSAGLGTRLPDACSGGNSTFASVPRLLTAVDPGDSEGAAEKPTILALAKAAGAKTAYLTNHETWVVRESGHDWVQKLSSMEHQGYDDIAVEALEDFVKRIGTGPKAAILHIYGQHFLYEDRYPHSVFEPEPEGLSTEALEELRYQRAAEYGNKILLAVAEILDAQQEPAFLVFTSDHGENLASDATGKKYHAGPITGKNVTTVPAIVLWNKAFLAGGRQQILESLLKAQGLIAHRDVANAWLALEGMPGSLEPTVDPKTWGSTQPENPIDSISCSTLEP